MKDVLAGIRVLDFCWVGAGALVTKLLAEHGADVIKVESRARPDNLRVSPPFRPGAEGLDGSGYFASRNNDKRSLVLNMSKPILALLESSRIANRPDLHGEMLGVHHRQRLDVGQPMLDDAVLRAAQHRRRDVDADQAIFPVVALQRDAGADADFEDAPARCTASPLGGGDRRPPAALKHRAEHQVVDRRPALVSLRDPRAVDICSHASP